jgi:1,4-alpha-glucan branching enzyme
VLFQNGTRIKQVTETTLTQDITASGSGVFKLVARAWYQSVAKADSVYYFIRTTPAIAEVPAGLRPGVNITGDNSAVFLLYAPEKSNVFVVGDFNNWVYCSDGFMNKSPDGNWYWLEVTGLDPAVEYGFQYFIDESIRVCDPYSTKILDPWNDKFITAETYPDLKPYPEGFAENLVSVFQTRPPQYVWKNSSFTPPEKNNMIIYELLVRDFVAAHDFNTIRDTLSYLKRLGVNAIEFMPVTEFDGNSSWGYNPAMYFAVDKYYGPSDTFKELIDSCHSNGIAVIMDMVLNHAFGNNPLVRMYFNSSTNEPASNNPWFNVESPNPYISFGYDFNHESPATQAFVDSVCHYWVSEFRVDGYRFDFTKGFTNTPGDGYAYDASRIAILERMGNRIWSYKPDAALILEHFTENSEEKELASYGFLLWGDGKYGYRNASMGKSTDNSFWQSSWKNVGWDVPGLMDYMESHDEERIMYLNETSGEAVAGYNIRDFNTGIKRIKLDATFFLTIPGTKMLWQFEELGYDYSIEYNTRLGEKPIKWDFYDDPVRRNLFDNFAALIELKKKNPAFSSNDFTLYESGMTKRLNIQSSDMDVVVLGNFSLLPQTIDPNFTKTGTWYEFFSGYTRDVSAGSQNTPISLLQGEYRLFTTKQLARPSFLLSVESPTDAGDSGLIFDAYPNPFSEELVISFAGADEYRPHTVEIFSADGARVRMMAVPAGISDITVDGAGIAAGICYIKVTAGRVSQMQKVIKI